ncbi:MAG: GTPase ObgE [Lentisphaeria bacterium]|nr:GTPase ObgE [Lentisphaeria bacterium]
MFIDKTQITVQAGHGGAGSCSFRRAKYIPNGGPDGGDGGRGGDVVIYADHGESSLVDLRFQPKWKAEAGECGHGRQKHGKNGADCRIRVPMGTLIFDADTDELLCDLKNDGQEFVVAKGGKGGLGNLHFVSSTNRAPRICQPGLPGEERNIDLEVKLIANVGLVGFPNAGKSTLLGAVSAAHPTVAAYPFTTLYANVGAVEMEDYRRITIADIPGLIDGAHDNVGLGEAFLRHIERCRLFCYVLDMAGVDGRDPLEDLKTLRKELELYSPGMSSRPYVIFANKMDLPEAAENLKRLVESEPAGTDIVSGCGELKEGTADLINLLQRRLDALPPEDEEATARVLAHRHSNLQEPSQIRKDAFAGWD